MSDDNNLENIVTTWNIAFVSALAVGVTCALSDAKYAAIFAFVLMGLLLMVKPPKI